MPAISWSAEDPFEHARVLGARTPGAQPGNVDRSGQAGRSGEPSGWRSAHFSAPYPPIDRPATNVSSRRSDTRKKLLTRSGSSSVRNVQ